MSAAASSEPVAVPIDLAVVGAVALDEIHSSAGDVEQELGGSAVYASLAASLLAEAAPISVIGDDFTPSMLDVLRVRGVRLDGIDQVEGPNFRWGCQYSTDGDVRETLYTHGGVYDSHPIVVADALRRARYVLLTAGNPDQNQRAMEQIEPLKLVALDTIEREVVERRDEFRDQLHYADIVSINTLEASHLIEWPGALDDPRLPPAAWSEIRPLGPSVFIHKRASHGVEIFEDGRRTVVSAVPNVAATDPTGAGDTFIGALLSALARDAELTQAAVWGCAVASFAIEHFGIAGLSHTESAQVMTRAQQITVNGVPADFTNFAHAQPCHTQLSPRRRASR